VYQTEIKIMKQKFGQVLEKLEEDFKDDVLGIGASSTRQTILSKDKTNNVILIN